MLAKKSILYINNGSGLSDVQSGGTLRHIETAKVVKQSHPIFVITTIGGLGNYRNNNLKFNTEVLVSAHLWREKETSNLDRIVSYFISTLHSLYLIILKQVPKATHVYSTSDYFCDVLPAVLYKIIYNSQYISMVHHRAAVPHQRSGDFILNLVSYIFQRFSFILIRVFSDGLLIYDTPEGKSIVKIIRPRKHFYVKNGISFIETSTTASQKKEFEVCFAGGLRETKGIYDLIPIWSHIVTEHPKWKIVVAGGGTTEVTESFISRIKKAKLNENIILTGPLTTKDLYKLIKSSKVFLSTSHEEGWGIAVLESIALGTPVVAFDLPAFGYLKNLIVRVSGFNHTRAARELIELVQNESLLHSFLSKGPEFASEYDWIKIGEEEVKIINEI